MISFWKFSSVQSLSRFQLFATPWTVARQVSLSITNCYSCSNSCPSSWWCHPTIISLSISPSIRVFSNELTFCIRWPKYWNFSFSNSSSNEYSGLISFRIDCLDLLAVQGTLVSLLQHHNLKDLRKHLIHSIRFQFSSVQFSRSVVSDSLRRHESQHARPPCPSPTPRVHSNSRPLSQWCHPAISFSVVPFSSCPQSLPASESFKETTKLPC